jgi:ribosomal protein S18 acetylase RimI-like enzyme
MIIRKMAQDDAARVAEITGIIMNDAWKRYEKGYYPRKAVDFDIASHSKEHFTESLRSADSISLVAEEEGRVVGVVSGRLIGLSGLARLGWLGVLPESQGRGIGRELLEGAIVQCRERGCHKITLYTLPVLLPAVNLYMKAGFVPESYLRREWWEVDFLKMSTWL